MIAWLFSLPFVTTLLRAAVAALEAVTPALRAASALLVWLVQKVWWPGLRGMLDGLPQVLVVAQLAALAFLFWLNASSQVEEAERALAQCRAELARPSSPQSRPPLWDPFGWLRLQLP